MKIKFKKILHQVVEKNNNKLLMINEYDDKNIDKIFYDNIHLKKYGHEYISKIILQNIENNLLNKIFNYIDFKLGRFFYKNDNFLINFIGNIQLKKNI